jgi:microsomal dipeptidase-like Zn-dependent dipeptidase
LLAYLAKQPGGHPGSTEDIGCAIPYLQEGRVALQVMAVYTTPGDNSVEFAERQVDLFGQLLREHAQVFAQVTNTEQVTSHFNGTQCGIVLGIEGGSGFCTEGEPLAEGLARLDRIVATVKRVIYISLTHNAENRFGGGNASTAGLKDDGRVLLYFLSGRGIAVDLSHTSDALAHGVLNYLEARALQVPVIASHSNFRARREHPRNLTDDVAREVIRRKGLIGINFLREFVDPDKPETLQAHIEHGLALGAEEALCFGADFFHTGDHPDKSRIPFFFPQHENALCYQPLLADLCKNHGEAHIRRLAHGNVISFLERNWTSRTS